VYQLFSKEHQTCPNNSVHNFSYASNYLLSKVQYKYACKLDDDHLAIVDTLLPTLNYIRQNGLSDFLVTPLLNVQINDKKFVIASDNYRSVFA
jgi:hypothetical protein